MQTERDTPFRKRHTLLRERYTHTHSKRHTNTERERHSELKGIDTHIEQHTHRHYERDALH